MVRHRGISLNSKQTNMKKLIILLAVISSSLVASDTFAQTKAPIAVTETFENSFSYVKEASWSMVADFYKAEFKVEDQSLFAYFNTDGEIVATGREITVAQLPIALQLELKNNYKDFTVTQSVEMAFNDESTYYLTIETATKKMQINSTDFGGWETYKKGNLLN